MKLKDIKPKRIKKKKIEYLNIECGFDIETTSTTLANGEKTAFMYIWTFGLGDERFIRRGRTWEDFKDLCKELQDHFKLSEDRRLICYVHNLAYEFQFMRKWFEWIDVFAVDDRKPVKALCTYGIEFRDSYILSGFSLSRLADNLQFHKIDKLVGDLDYSLIRHSGTELSDKELEYCNNDVIIILYYINEQIELYGDITKIPLTNTGRVRSYVREKCYYTDKSHKKSSGGKFQRYRQIMKDLQIDKDVYTMCKRAFMGGFTHANANKSNKLIDNVTSIDFTSSYPAVMLTEGFPMSKGIKTEFTKEKDFKYYKDRYCLLFDVRFKNITSKIQYENYISESKCMTLKNPVLNNGRVFSADELVTTITDVDYNIIENAYNWDSVEVANVYRFHKGYLPKSIIESIIELYEKKTELKDVEGKEVEYTLSKGMLNSIYGMSVTDIIRDEISYINDWDTDPADMDEQIESYNVSHSRFLYYPWGVWVTAYARRNLWYGITVMKDDYIYSDTDSVKFENLDKHMNFIKEYNQMVMVKLQNMCNHYNIDIDRLSPKTIEGVPKPIGVWDFDGDYKRFKTLGAKRYLVEFQDGSMEMTVAGLSKKNGLEYLQNKYKDNTEVFNNFDNELYVPAEETGKMTHTYIDSENSYMIQDYQGNEGYVHTKSCIHLEPCDFTLSITRQYIDFIENLSKGYLYIGQQNV